MIICLLFRVRTVCSGAIGTIFFHVPAICRTISPASVSTVSAADTYLPAVTAVVIHVIVLRLTIISFPIVSFLIAIAFFLRPIAVIRPAVISVPGHVIAL